MQTIALQTWLLVILLPLSTIASATDMPSHPCSKVVEPVERLSCYDKAFPPPPAVHEAMAGKAVRDFGLDKQAAPVRNSGSVESVDPDRIESKVIKVVYGPGGGRTVTLDNGQVWALTESTSRGHMTEGERVSVRKGALGSFMLVTQAGVGLRVRRVR